MIPYLSTDPSLICRADHRNPVTRAAPIADAAAGRRPRHPVPITVKKALTTVAGVTQVTVDLEKKQAVVTFDDAKTNAVALTKATTNAGYPSTVKEK